MRKFLSNWFHKVSTWLQCDIDVIFTKDIGVIGTTSLTDSTTIHDKCEIDETLLVGSTAGIDETYLAAQMVGPNGPGGGNFIEVSDSLGASRKRVSLGVDNTDEVALNTYDHGASALIVLNLKCSELKVNSVIQPFRKVIEIGDWNMDTDATKSVAHGLTLSKIVGVSAIIRNDAGSIHYPLLVGRDVAAANIGAGNVSYVGAATVALYRATGGTFDASTFDSTSYNRGWVIVDYIA